MTKLELINSKVLNDKSLHQQLAIWRFLNKKIVFTNGCFDILHLGHIDYLSKAKDLGNILLIGLNTDDSVKRLKGDNRPIIKEQERAIFLASLLFVDGVILFDEDTPYNLIKGVEPDILVKGSDYKKEEIVGADIIQETGGEIITIDFLKGYSTTSILDKIRKVV
ncbi:MAG: D-glycero-beta-D-manno-heptose 1-phosphate adenylyltransferase [Candidatus Cloacimonadota bacterium]|nr:MAG: D-glycero-beta-D-manno-heptose 1-phosphate adenylyltransferase [Candidatus Cloacimonadota bacterium]